MVGHTKDDSILWSVFRRGISIEWKQTKELKPLAAFSVSFLPM